MTRATNEEVFGIMEASYARGPQDEMRVHRSRQNEVRRPRPGHLYHVPGRPTDTQMASMSDRAGPAEAALLKINDAYFVRIGVRGTATANVLIPQRDTVSTPQAIVEFAWVNHTHPLDMENEYERVIQGPSDADHEALRHISRRWDQRSSYIIVCRNGRAIRRVEFRLEPDIAAGCRVSARTGHRGGIVAP